MTDWVTTEDYDKTIIKEVFGYQKLLDAFGIELEGSRILDLGAHKGYFSRYALARGAATVVAVEPFAGNIKVLKKNASDATIIHAACIGWKAVHGATSLTKAPRNKYSASYSVARKSPARTEVEIVPTVQFRALAQEHKISLVKMDFQGSEWGVFNTSIPACVKTMFGELHYSGRFEIAEGKSMTLPPLKDKRATDRILKNLKDQGFKLNFRKAGKWEKSPPYGTKMWFQDVVFCR